MSGEGSTFIPRILLKDIPEKMKVPDIYMQLRKFGVITYIGLGVGNAVVEFADRVTLGKVLSRCPLRLGGKNVCVSHEPEWEKIVHFVKKHELFILCEDLKTVLQNQEKFCAKVDYLIGMADKISIVFDDDPEHQIKPASQHPVCSVVEKILCEKFSPDVRVYPFGSRVTGTALETSDLDLFIDFDNRFYSGRNRDAAEQAEYVATVKRFLGKSFREFGHVTPVPRARVPIVRFHHYASDTRCDASFNNGLGCRNARLVKFILSLDDRIRQLILFSKFWAYFIKLKSDTNTTNRPELTSHALTMLIFTYLQTTSPPILPPIKHMKESADYSLDVGGWETAFCNDRERFRITAHSDNRTVRELFLGFMRHFQSVDWSRLAASPLDGACIQRNKLHHKIPAKDLPLVVLDPFNLFRNLTANVSDETLCHLLAACALTVKEMTGDNA